MKEKKGEEEGDNVDFNGTLRDVNSKRRSSD